MSEETLRALIRYLHPITSLRNDLEQSMHMENYAGLGNAAVKTYVGLHASIARVVDDPYLNALTLETLDSAGDKERVSLVLLVAGQLLAYIQGHLGLSLPSKSGSNHIQTAPVIQLNHIGVEATEQVMEITRRALGSDEEDEAQDV